MVWKYEEGMGRKLTGQGRAPGKDAGGNEREQENKKETVRLKSEKERDRQETNEVNIPCFLLVTDRKPCLKI